MANFLLETGGTLHLETGGALRLEDAPAASPVIIAVPGNLQIFVSWQPVIGAVSYNIYQGGVLTVTGVRNIFGVLTGLTNGTQYAVTVTAVDSQNIETDPSNEVDVTPSRLPIVESIRQQMLAVLQSVTTANGYAGTLDVEEVSRHGNDATDLVTIVEQGEEKSILGDEDDGGAIGKHTHEQEFLVFINVQNPNDAPAFDLRCNVAAADVRQALLMDVNRGGLCQWTHLSRMKLFSNEHGQVAGVMVPFDVQYRTKLDDPYTLG